MSHIIKLTHAMMILGTVGLLVSIVVAYEVYDTFRYPSDVVVVGHPARAAPVQGP